MTTAIMGPPSDAQVAAVATRARELGHEVTVVRPDLGAVGRWQWSTDEIVDPDGVRIDQLDSLFIRSIPVVSPAHSTAAVPASEQEAWLSRHEGNRARHGFLKSVLLAAADRGVDVFNPVETFWFHRSKPAAELRLAAAGVPIPRGVATSDPALVEELIDEVGEVVYKPVAGGGRCRKLDPAALRGPRAASLRHAPCYFQERIVGRDLRLYLVGGELLAAFIIDTDDIDYRGRETSITPVEVDEDVLDSVRRATDALGLVYTGADVKLCPDGRHVVLDVNPSAMFAGIDHLVDGRIADGIARRLVGGRNS